MNPRSIRGGGAKLEVIFMENLTTYEEIMHYRGKRDGLAELTPSSTSEIYLKAYFEGRCISYERKMQYG